LEVYCILVPKNLGEIVRKEVLQEGLLHATLKIKPKGEKLLIPLKSAPADDLKNNLQKISPEISFVKEKMEIPITNKQKSFRDLLKDKLPPEKNAFIPRSFDIIGNIGILEVPDDLKPHARVLAETLMTRIPHLKSVYEKAGIVEGKYRTRRFNFLAGIDDPVTIHKENHCQFKVNMMKVYFNPRLSTERARITSMIHPNEVVLDLFAGVGPFSIQIAKKGAIVHAIDINPDAVELLKQNILLNKVENHVVPHLGDAREIVPEKLRGKFDFVIMNLPKEAIKHLDLYHEVNDEENMDDLIKKLLDPVKKHGFINARVNSAKKVHNLAPYRWQKCFEIIVS